MTVGRLYGTCAVNMSIFATVFLLVAFSLSAAAASLRTCTAKDIRNVTLSCEGDEECLCRVTYMPLKTTCVFNATSLPNLPLFQEVVVECHRRPPAPPCTTVDVGNLTSICKEGFRHRYFYWTKNCEVNSSVADLPPPLKLPCDCPAGMGLVTTNTCQACAPGAFNPGGDVIDDWSGWSSTGRAGEHLGFVTWCEMGYGDYSEKSCLAWKEGGNGAYLTSGKQPKSIHATSILILDREFTEETGSAVGFQYRVDGAMCFDQMCDGLEFYIDDALVMNMVNRQIMWTTFRKNVTMGSHRLMWIFYKQSICNEFSSEQMAYIKSVTLTGTASVDVDCYLCPAGKFSSAQQAGKCEECLAFSYQNEMGHPKCMNCEKNTFSFGGATKCSPQSNCTPNDIVLMIDPVSKCHPLGGSGDGSEGALVRNMTETYLTPFNFKKSLCNATSSQQSSLHVYKNYTCYCQPGQMLSIDDKGKVVCHLCPSGNAPNSGTTCEKCLAGTAGRPGHFFHEWTVDTLNEFHSACVGQCDGNGWIPNGDHVRTAVGITDSYLSLKNIIITAEGGAIEFNCSVNCTVSKRSGGSPASNIANVRDCYLYFEMANDNEVQGQLCGSHNLSSQWDGTDSIRDGTVQVHNHILKPGKYSFRWRFHQQGDLQKNVNFVAKVAYISIVGVAHGSARNCTPCPPGYYSSDGASKCKPCPPGQYSGGGTRNCSRCQGNNYTDVAGSAACKKCGSSTTVNSSHTGCDVTSCSVEFRLENSTEVVVYNLSHLRRFNGSMIEAKKDNSSYYYFLNLCTTVHDNSSCAVDGKPIATMACQQKCQSKYGCLATYSLGDTIGFQKASDVLSGLVVEFTHGSSCSENVSGHTTVHMICDQYAGIGQPQPCGKSKAIENGMCNYVLEWRSTYACPVCREEYFSAVYGKCSCSNGTRLQQFMKMQPCWGGHQPINGIINCPSEQCSSGGVNKAAVGVGVTLTMIIVILIAFMIFVFYRAYSLKNYTSLGKATRMEKLRIVDDTDDDSSHFPTGGDVDRNKDNPFASDM